MPRNIGIFDTSVGIQNVLLNELELRLTLKYLKT